MNICHTCGSNSGEKRISPGCQIYNGQYWLVEHAYPSDLVGWLVIVLKRHCEKLHELNKEEWAELSEIEYKIMQYIKTKMECEKEYCACFAEMEGYKHIHFHIIPKTNEYDPELKGSKAFQYLKIKEVDNEKQKRIIKLCEDMNEYMKQMK